MLTEKEVLYLATQKTKGHELQGARHTYSNGMTVRLRKLHTQGYLVTNR